MKTTAEYTRLKRQRRDALGLCIMCGTVPQKMTSKLCQSCTDRTVEAKRRLREIRVAEGKCSHCLTREPLPERRMCKVCLAPRSATTPEARLAKTCANHGISVADYNALLESQHGRCAICKGEPSGRWGRLDIDHCHATGVVRGLLCHECNKGLGCFRDNEGSLAEAISYLRPRSQFGGSSVRRRVSVGQR